jgi:PhoPQ-activated pathogenicity-related protein
MALTGVRAGADLDSYFSRPEPAYKWELVGEKSVDGCKVYDLKMVSQVWQGITWTHHVEIFKPDNLKHPEFCTIFNTGGHGSLKAADPQGLALAKSTGCLSCILWDNPNQPLYGGKTEDELIIHTWLRFLTTGDETWPLHIPMAKAVLKTMDTVQAFAKSERWKPVNSFLICGGSKRGWTTWLCGASRDPRVKAIAPMVIDILNLPAQTPHMTAVYGGLTLETSDYGRVSATQLISSPRGRRLVELEDPYSYRERITMPKLIILGTNDPYWTQDALNLYWDGLPAQKWISYTPNSVHGLDDRAHVAATLSAFIVNTAGHGHWPDLRWRYTKAGNGVDLELTSDIPIQSARLFRCHSNSTDFRMERWTADPIQGKGRKVTTHFDSPAEGNEAIFGEATFNIRGHEFTLSSQLYVLGKNAAVFVEPGETFHPTAP